MSNSRWKKAQWIAEQLEAKPDDVYDVLLGYITSPWELYSGVESLSREYDAIYLNKVEKNV